MRGKKQVTIYDYVDAQEPMLARMAAKRAVGYRRHIPAQSERGSQRSLNADSRGT
jgi:hypothetical protein